MSFFANTKKLIELPDACTKLITMLVPGQANLSCSELSSAQMVFLLLARRNYVPKVRNLVSDASEQGTIF